MGGGEGQRKEDATHRSSPLHGWRSALFSLESLDEWLLMERGETALVLFMLTESYALLVVSRFLQGISGTGIWTLGLSLITDSVPEERIGRVMVRREILRKETGGRTDADGRSCRVS